MRKIKITITDTAIYANDEAGQRIISGENFGGSWGFSSKLIDDDDYTRVRVENFKDALAETLFHLGLIDTPRLL